MGEEVKKELIPSLREGVDVVRMIFFKNMKDYFTGKYPEAGNDFPGLCAAAVMNELFGTPNPEEKFAGFAADNRETINRELNNISTQFPELCIPLTDALRIHFLCNQQEGVAGDHEATLRRARDLGGLLEDREVPLPKGFMELVGRLGKSYGFINS
ncbi:MAG: hypothetical protein ACLFV2_06015 [Desulfurivibrionaceae bacterium]